MKKLSDNTWVELRPRILAENIRLLRQSLNSDTDIYFVVKANAYGHGLAEMVHCAWEEGIRKFAVCYIEEALYLRELAPDAEIMIMGVLAAKDVPAAIDEGFNVFIVDLDHARQLSSEARRLDNKLKCHVVVDSGMGRLGVMWDSAVEVINEITGLPGLSITGLVSHFASADDGDKAFARTQIERFRGVIEECERRRLKTGSRHISSSAGILSCPDWDFDAVRPGIMLYGYPGGSFKTAGKTYARAIPIRPVLQWKTTVIQVRKAPNGFPVSYGSCYITDEPTKIGIINAGYADGYPVSLSNKGRVIIRGRVVPVIGRVTMNLTVVNLGLDSDVEEGDEVILIGEQNGKAVWADDLAECCGTISYEILTNIRTSRRIIVPD